MRIISLVPSITEFLFDLGLDEEVVGLTKFCVHPAAKWKSLPRVGGTKTVNHERIGELKPDLILANKEENTREDVERLRDNYTVLLTDIVTVGDAFTMMEDVGREVGRKSEAQSLRLAIQNEWNKCKGLANGETLAYAIWNNPLMVAGGATYINAVLEWFGWDNIVKEARYPEMSIEELARLKPDRLMLSSEPFPFKEKHLGAFQAQLPNCKVECVDGEMFSWYGSRMKYTPDYVKRLVE